jgi:hypothetical protein
MSIQALRRPAPAPVGPLRRRVPRPKVVQQRPRTTVAFARLGTTLQMLSILEVSVHRPHRPVQNVAGEVSPGVRVGLAVLPRPAAQLLDLRQRLALRPDPQAPYLINDALEPSGANKGKNVDLPPQTAPERFGPTIKESFSAPSAICRSYLATNCPRTLCLLLSK